MIEQVEAPASAGSTRKVEAGLTFFDTLIMVWVLGVLAVLAAAFFSWFSPREDGPAQLVKEFMSVGYGGKPSDVNVYVTFAPGDQAAVVRAETGKLSCLVDTAVADDDVPSRFGWRVTGAHCVPTGCDGDEVAPGSEGETAACAQPELSAGTIEERTIEAEGCSPESGYACVGIDLEALSKAAESGELSAPAADAE